MSTKATSAITDKMVEAGAKELKRLDTIKGVDAYYERQVRAVLEAVLPHTPASQPGAVKAAVWIEREVLDALMKDKTASGTVCSGLLNEPFGDKVGLFTAVATPPAQGEPVAWQRLHPTLGWIEVSNDDRCHYQAVGQEIRSLYATPQPNPAPAPAEQAPTVAVESADLDAAIKTLVAVEVCAALEFENGAPSSQKEREITTELKDARHAVNQALCARARAEQREAPAPAETDVEAREGWKLVPIEPTEAMLNANSGTATCHPQNWNRAMWAAFLAAAPTSKPQGGR